MTSHHPERILRVVIGLALAAMVVGAEGAPKKVNMAEAMNQVVTKVAPEYPPLARQLKISGNVELEVVISESGSVEAVSPLSGNPVLTKPAAEAVRKWKFKPFLEGSAPVKVEAAIKISFNNN